MEIAALELHKAERLKVRETAFFIQLVSYAHRKPMTTATRRLLLKVVFSIGDQTRTLERTLRSPRCGLLGNLQFGARLYLFGG